MRATRMVVSSLLALVGVAAAVFAINSAPPEAVRVCLGRPADRTEVRGVPEFLAHALAESPALASTFL